MRRRRNIAPVLRFAERRLWHDLWAEYGTPTERVLTLTGFDPDRVRRVLQAVADGRLDPADSYAHYVG